MITHPQGSEWRRWDLHFHTPASFDYKSKALTASHLVNALRSANVALVAVTDHHVMDVPLIRSMQEIGQGVLTVLPGIEFRSELGGSENVHYIGIFPENCDIDKIWMSLQVKLDISPSEVAKKTDEKIYVEFVKGCEAIHELGGFVTVHAGKRNNSIEGMKNNISVHQQVKTDLIKRHHIDAYEVGKLEDCEAYKSIVFPSINMELPLFMSSDNHDAHQYSVKCPMWIKADPNFYGLLQLKNEPNSRIYLGDEPPGALRVRTDPTNYLKSVKFSKTEHSKVGQTWFTGNVVLNPGLVAIIGKKGGGKSALADVIGLLGSTRNQSHFSFLNASRFCQSKNNLGRCFMATATWQSGATVQKRLDAQTLRTEVELVKYIPQNFLEDICGELKDSTDTQFDIELRAVIFSHVNTADQLSFKSLDDLIKYKTGECEDRVRYIVNDLSSVNSQIIALEEMRTTDYITTLENQLNKYKAELLAHDSLIPQTVAKPEIVPDSLSSQPTNDEIQSLQVDEKSIQAELSAHKEVEKASVRKITAADKLLARLTNLQRQHQSFNVEATDDANEIGVSLENIVRLSIDDSEILRIKKAAEADRRDSLSHLDPTIKDSHASQLIGIQEQLEALRKKLDEPNRLYQEYVKARALWQTRRDEITGSPEVVNSLRGIESQIAQIDRVPDKLRDLETRRNILCREVYQILEELIVQYKQLYAPVQDFINHHPLSRDQVVLEFEASIAVEGLHDGLFNLVSQARKGTFYGTDEGRSRLAEIVAMSDFQTAIGTMQFINNLLGNLKVDSRSGRLDDEVEPKDQLKQGISLLQLYDFIFSLNYLKPRFVLRWQGKDLDQLSPGERGNLLLIFYLLIDKRRTPLLIDQPEENLDNQTIASTLVPCIKDAKERRQIILVTHNPNLAVVCDADQVIHADIDKVNCNAVTYKSGSLENPEMNQLILDVLEGTKPAFNLRAAKYDSAGVL